MRIIPSRSRSMRGAIAIKSYRYDEH